MKKLMAVNPPEVYAWDDAGNNRWLISGKGSGIMNPPSAWAVAKRDNPKVAEQSGTHAMPNGPKGRFVGQLPQFYGAVDVLEEQVRRQGSPAAHLAEGADRAARRGFVRLRPAVVQEHVRSSDLEDGRAAGTASSTAIRRAATSRPRCSAHPARADVGAQIYNQAINTVMVAKVTQGNEKHRRRDQVGRERARRHLARLSAFGLSRHRHAGLVGRRVSSQRHPNCLGSARRMADTVQSSWVHRQRPQRAGQAERGHARFMRRRSTIAFADVLAADRGDRRPRHLSGVLFDLSVHAEQGADALYRARQFHLSVVARRVLDGGRGNRRSSRSRRCSSKR